MSDDIVSKYLTSSNLPSWFDQSKIAAAIAAQGPSADGRTILTGNNLLSVLNSLSGVKINNDAGQYTGYVNGDGGDAGGGATQTYHTAGTVSGPDGFGLQTLGIGDQYANDGQYSSGLTPAQAQAMGLDPSKQYVTGQFTNPTGNGDKDVAQAIYQVNADGTAVPVQAKNAYNPSSWVDTGRDLTKAAAILGGSAFGAQALAGAAGAAGAGASTAGAAGAGAAGAAEAGGALGAGGVADVGGLTALDSAAYGAAGDAFLPTGGALAGGAGSAASPGFLSSLTSGNLGDAASAAGKYLTSPSGLQTLGSLGSTLLQSNASNNALSTLTDSTNSANALQRYFYDTNRADNAPLLATRNQALTGLNGLMSNPSSITSDPGYQFGLNQGQTAVDRSAASKGGLYSGATLKALQRYGTDYGTTKLNDSYNRLTSVAGLGNAATASNTASATNTANQTAANTTALGSAGASAALNQGNLYSNLLNGAVSAYKTYGG